MFGMFPSRGVWRRPGLRPVDLLVFAALLALLFGLLRLAPALNAPFLPRTAPSTVSTDPANLPYYAVRSLLRMFIGLILSVLFTFVYATAAARLRRAEKVLIPVLDILQSVPVLGFLTVTVTAFSSTCSPAPKRYRFLADQTRPARRLGALPPRGFDRPGDPARGDPGSPLDGRLVNRGGTADHTAAGAACVQPGRPGTRPAAAPRPGGPDRRLPGAARNRSACSIALLAHYASGGEFGWLAEQTYLRPFPPDLRLR